MWRCTNANDLSYRLFECNIQRNYKSYLVLQSLESLVSCACLDKSLFLSFSKKSLFLLVRLCNYRSGSRLSLTFDNILCSIYIEQSLVIWLIQLERDFSYKFDNYMDTPESTTCIKWICKSSTYTQVSEAHSVCATNKIATLIMAEVPFSKTS